LGRKKGKIGRNRSRETEIEGQSIETDREIERMVRNGRVGEEKKQREIEK
jgi:hypothetical protein